MALQRVFLDWHGPALARVVDFLAERFGASAALELSNVVVAVPGARAGRRLLELLVERAEAKQLIFEPPRIVTVGTLPELLYAPKKRFASNLVQQLAWGEAVKQVDAAACKTLLPALPAKDDRTSWLALGDLLARLHRELAADKLDFKAVADCGGRFPEFRERARWECLAAIQTEYLRILDGLDLWDLQTARIFAVDYRECRAEQDVVLVGLVDLNLTQRLMLDQVAEKGDGRHLPERPEGCLAQMAPIPFSGEHGATVTALVIAPPELADRFDEYGCLRPEAWLDECLGLETRQIAVVESPAEQAATVLRAIASWKGRYPAQQITIGVPDERLVPYLEQHLEQYELRARWGVGRPVSRSATCRLLESVADYLESPRYASLAALVRHPAIHRWLASKKIAGDWLSPMDRYYSEHLPNQIGAPWLGDDEQDAVKRVYREIQKALTSLGGSREETGTGSGRSEAPVPVSSRRPLDQWAQPLLDLLCEIHGDGPLNPDIEPDRSILAACKCVHAALAEHRNIPKDLMPPMTAAEAIRLVLREIGGETMPALPDREAIEMLGWLELPLDDAPALVVTGLNEGIVPSSLNADLFLPNQLRRALGLEDNDRRCARDAYALAVLAASREKLTVIAGRRGSEGDPLIPSRLLFACDDAAMARRVKAFFGDEPSPGSVSTGTLRPAREHSQFEPPRPRPLDAPITSLRVTQFKDYLACPYRFYLRHVLGLQSLGDSSEELDGAMFGSLAHAVLDEFGKGPLKDSTDAEQIEEFLNVTLDYRVRRQFGQSPLAAVLVQVEQLRRRLAALARWQAGWAAAGWRIEDTEVTLRGETAKIVVDCRPMHLRGRIDRIDVHADGRRIIFDYKSSDTAKKPEQTHGCKDGWIDLQLPLYRHLVAGLGIGGPVQLGYIVLPKDTSKAGSLLAEWTEDDLRTADRTAEEVVRSIWAERFWPPASPPPEFSEEFSAICLDAQFGNFFGEEEEGEAG